MVAFACALACAWQSAVASQLALAEGGVTLPVQLALHEPLQVPEQCGASPPEHLASAETSHLPEQVPEQVADAARSQLPSHLPSHEPLQLPLPSIAEQVPEHLPWQVPSHVAAASKVQVPSHLPSHLALASA